MIDYNKNEKQPRESQWLVFDFQVTDNETFHFFGGADQFWSWMWQVCLLDLWIIQVYEKCNKLL